MNLFYIVFSYLLGSIPFGYIITKLSTQKNILEIGWRKTSGSNVFKNVGKWQGILTGVFDVLKGFFAVRLAQNLGLSTQTQILSGVVAVIGHNWSLFLRFAGGRGISTFMGAFWAFSPDVLKLSLVPGILLALIWTAAIGTILFLLFAIILSVCFNQADVIGLFTLLSLGPIFLKRLSPLGEIKKAKKKTSLIINRLIFDDDSLPKEWRIEKMVNFLTKH
jgi:glycerol-3-phosphate acyltransferase PlsY